MEQARRASEAQVEVMDTDSNLTHRTAVPASALLSAWNGFEWDNGVNLNQLAPLDRVTVRTRHSLYEIIVLSTDSAEVLVRGGEFFPEFTRVRLAGSSLGGSFLKLRTIHVGFRLELSLGRTFVLTSPVRRISLIADESRAADVM
jgi:hypothetical protein